MAIFKSRGQSQIKVIVPVAVIIRALFCWGCFLLIRIISVAVFIFATVFAPIAVTLVLYLVKHLDAALYYLQDSARQETLLNENLQENIRQLNFEIEK